MIAEHIPFQNFVTYFPIKDKIFLSKEMQNVRYGCDFFFHRPLVQYE